MSKADPEREAYCLYCEKEGHRTNECHSTHGLNAPRAREISRLARGTTARAPLPEPSMAGVLGSILYIAEDPKRGEGDWGWVAQICRAALSPQPAPPNSAQGHQTASDSESPEAVGDGCRKCGGEMRPGKAIFSTWGGSPDFIGDAVVVTMSPSGPGRLVDCLKCARCGWSVTTTASGLSANSRSDSKDGGGDHHE